MDFSTIFPRYLKLLLIFTSYSKSFFEFVSNTNYLNPRACTVQELFNFLGFDICHICHILKTSISKTIADLKIKFVEYIEVIPMNFFAYVSRFKMNLRILFD